MIRRPFLIIKKSLLLQGSIVFLFTWMTLPSLQAERRPCEGEERQSRRQEIRCTRYREVANVVGALVFPVALLTVKSYPAVLAFFGLPLTSAVAGAIVAFLGAALVFSIPALVTQNACSSLPHSIHRLEQCMRDTEKQLHEALKANQEKTEELKKKWQVKHRHAQEAEKQARQEWQHWVRSPEGALSGPLTSSRKAQFKKKWQDIQAQMPIAGATKDLILEEALLLPSDTDSHHPDVDLEWTLFQQEEADLQKKEELSWSFSPPPT